MVQLDFSSLGPKVKIDDILAHVTEEQIYTFLCPEFPKDCFECPWRKDVHPSFGFYKAKNGKWRWKDMASGDNGTWIDYVMNTYPDIKTVPEALAFIAQKFNVVPETNNFRPQAAYNSNYKKRATETTNEDPKDLQIYGRKYSRKDLAYWEQWPITRNILAYYDTKVADQVYADGNLVWRYTIDNPIFYYLYPKTGHLKAYRPLEGNKRRKWLSNTNNDQDMQGYHQCQIVQYPGRPLIILPKMKDIMFFRAFGFNAMGPHAEGHHLPEDFVRHIKKYCYPIVSMYDNDEAGMKAARKLEEDTQIPGIYICPKWGAKDPTDLWLHNYRKAYDLLNILDETFRGIKFIDGHSGASRFQIQTIYRENGTGLFETI